MLPWYRPQLPPGDRAPHPGLLFDRFCDQWDRSGVLEGPQKRKFLESVCEAYGRARSSLGGALARARARRERLVQALAGRLVAFTTSSRLVTGLGMTHVLETGFVWHPTLGVPYLPGSSVKGLVRALWDPANGWAFPTPGGAGADGAQIERLFGGEEIGVGSLVVLDALPTEPPGVEQDIMNVHYKNYYQDGTPPADYSKPNLVYFLAVKAGSRFEFGLAPRPGTEPALGSAPDDLEKAERLLRLALEVLGAGAKTAVGYGRLRA